MIAHQPEPVLLNSYKGHFMPVSSLTYIEECQILIRFLFYNVSELPHKKKYVDFAVLVQISVLECGL